jgi:hypothetical protein
LWIGNRSNLPPVVEWVNCNPLSLPLWVLTDLPDSIAHPSAMKLGFRDPSIRISRWTPERHVEWCLQAQAAFDIKDDGFRARHKPPAKTLDFLASGIPFAINTNSSAADHIQQEFGLRLASPDDHNRWLSDEYFRDVNVIALQLRTELTLERTSSRFLKLIAML